MALQAAFIFVAPQADANQHRSVITTAEVILTTVGVSNYAEACTVARQLVDAGVGAIELCGGFGAEGVAAVSRAVQGTAVVGAVRFDLHPGLGHRSGDALFA